MKNLRHRFTEWFKGYLRPGQSVATPYKVEPSSEPVVRPGVIKGDQEAVWSPDQHGGVIVAEPDAVRADRLRWEDDGK